MNVKRIIGTGLVLSLVASVGLVLGAPRAAHAGHDGSFSSSGNTQTVDCGGFFNTSINSVIQRSDLGRRLTINVKGHCVENVVIDRDHVTLQPAGSGGSIEAADPEEPAILITGRHVTVQDFNGDSISGGNYGVNVRHGGAASLLNNHITGAVEHGVFVTGASSLLLVGNLIDYNGRRGVAINSGSGLVSDNRIVFNGEYGAWVLWNASAFFEGNTISDNGTSGVFPGIVVGFGASVLLFGVPNTIQRNTGFGISCNQNSNLHIAPDEVITDNFLGQVLSNPPCDGPNIP